MTRNECYFRMNGIVNPVYVVSSSGDIGNEFEVFIVEPVFALYIFFFFRYDITLYSNAGSSVFSVISELGLKSPQLKSGSRILTSMPKLTLQAEPCLQSLTSVLI